MSTVPSSSERADALEHRQMRELGERVVVKSFLYHLADGERTLGPSPRGSRLLMGDDPRLPPMPEKPTLLDFFRLRFAPTQAHLLQSANLAQKNGLPEKMVLACLLHDIAVVGLIRADHGYWGAQLVEPYVDEEVSWAIRMHQALRFFPDESAGYEYPELYRTMFGEDYRPEPYIVADYERAKKHRWYMSARMICVNDLYSFDPDMEVELDQFEDVVGPALPPAARGSRQRRHAGLAYVAHAAPALQRAVEVRRRAGPRRLPASPVGWHRHHPLPARACVDPEMSPAPSCTAKNDARNGEVVWVGKRRRLPAPERRATMRRIPTGQGTRRQAPGHRDTGARQRPSPGFIPQPHAERGHR